MTTYGQCIKHNFRAPSGHLKVFSDFLKDLLAKVFMGIYNLHSFYMKSNRSVRSKWKFGKPKNKKPKTNLQIKKKIRPKNALSNVKKKHNQKYKINLKVKLNQYCWQEKVNTSFRISSTNRLTRITQ